MSSWERISLLSPEYLLSFERCPFHTETPDHYALVSYLLDLSVSQSSALLPLHSRTVTDRPEGTFRSLRYAFGGDHPSQTTHQAMSFYPEVRTQTNEGSYFNSGSTNTGVPVSLPPTYPTHRVPKFPMLSCSKGSRGLFVPSRVIGIFTDTTISPSSRLRQCPDHYTIRAGRNLPDKEFRYLRTVIVTAAVYWGFNSKLLLR